MLDLKNKKTIIVIIIGLLIVLCITYLMRGTIKDWLFTMQQEEIPEAVSYEEIVSTNNDDNTNSIDNTNQEEAEEVETIIETEPVEIPNSINLEIPFQSQAPHANWDMPWQEGCEEASVILTVNYLRGATSLTADQMNEKILTLVEWQNTNWGGHHDLTISETAAMVNGFYGDEFDTEIIQDFTWEDVKTALAQGYPVIIPAAGRQLGNPYYTPPGPIYHMLVIKGYTNSVVITNDPGTRRGADFQYNYDTIYNAIHDWNESDINLGEKVMLIIKPTS